MTETRVTLWDKLLRAGVAVLLVLMPFYALITVWPASIFGHYEAIRLWKEVLLLLLVLIATYLVLIDTGLRRWMAESWIVRLSLLYIAVVVLMALIPLLNGTVAPKAIGYGLIVDVRPVLFMLVCIVMVKRRNDVRWARMIVAPALIVVVFGLLQFFVLPPNFLRHVGYGPDTIAAVQTIDNKAGFPRVQSTLRGPNPLGVYLILPLTLLVLGVAHFKEKGRYGLAIGLTTVVLLATFSRSAVLGAALSVAVLLGWTVQRRSARRLFWWIIGVCLAAAFVLFLTLRQTNLAQNVLFHTSNTSKSSESSNAQRTRALKNGVKDLAYHPLGTGVGSAGPASFYNTDHPAKLSENYFLQIGQETGIVGLGLFIALLVFIMLRLWDRRQHGLSRAVLAILIGLIWVNMVSHAWADDTLAYLSWGLLAAGVTMKVSRGSLNEAEEQKPARS